MQVCARFGSVHVNVQARVSKTLLRAFLDTSKPLTTHHGAVMGLTALGHASVRLMLLPQLPAYLQRLQPFLTPPASAPGPSSCAAAAATHQGVGNTESNPDAMDVDLSPATANTNGNGPANGNAAREALPGGSPSGVAMSSQDVAAAMRRYEDAVRVHGAIVDGVAACLNELLVSKAAQVLPGEQPWNMAR